MVDVTAGMKLTRKSEKPKGALYETVRLILRSPTGIVGLSIILVYVILSFFGPAFAPYNPDAIHLSRALLPPSMAHLFGTDEYGRDIFSRVLYAIPLDMSIAFVSVSIGYSIGVLTGMVSGYVGKITDSTIMRGMDILFAFPSILLAIAIAVSIGPGYWTVVIAVIVVTIPGFARVSRSTVLSTKNDLYVTAAKAAGARRGHILLHHILPQAITPTIILYALNLGNAIILAASLSFLGVGIPPPTPELGAMVTNGLGYVVSGQWWISVLPGLFIVFIVIGFNMMGDAVREATDVTLRR
jgi:peptide/nickel transport system permease protein